MAFAFVFGYKEGLRRRHQERTAMKQLLSLLIALPLVIHVAGARADQLVLVAGGGTEKDHVPATKARLIAPFGVDFDKAGNIYIVELTGERVLRVDPKGMLTIAAGTGKKGSGGDGGPATMATFNSMHSLAVSPTASSFWPIP
jgi:hypothetical protein